MPHPNDICNKTILASGSTTQAVGGRSETSSNAGPNHPSRRHHHPRQGQRDHHQAQQTQGKVFVI